LLTGISSNVGVKHPICQPLEHQSQINIVLVPAKCLPRTRQKHNLEKNKHIWQTRNLIFNKKLDNEQELDSFVA
jgi:hypothetical protein